MSDEPTWRTREGETIPIRDLEDSHLVNIGRMLLRNAPAVYDRTIGDLLAASCFVHGEMATDALRDDLDGLMRIEPEDFVRSRRADIFEEIKRRGLDENLLPTETI